MRGRQKELMQETQDRDLGTVKIYKQTIRKIKILQRAAEDADLKKPSIGEIVEGWRLKAEGLSLEPIVEKVLDGLEKLSAGGEYTDRERLFVLGYLGLTDKDIREVARTRKNRPQAPHK